MKKCQIREGIIYRNRGKGTTYRRVIKIGDEHRPKKWYSDSTHPDEPGVLYADNKGRHERIYISSFAKWAGSIPPRIDDEENISNQLDNFWCNQ